MFTPLMFLCFAFLSHERYLWCLSCLVSINIDTKNTTHKHQCRNIFPVEMRFDDNLNKLCGLQKGTITRSIRVVFLHIYFWPS